MDILSEILNQIDLSSSFYYRTSFGSKWGLSMPETDSIARFHIVTKGSFWLSVDHVKYHSEIKEGDILIIFKGLEHKMKSSIDSEILSEIEFSTQSEMAENNTLQFGEQNEKATNIVCGHFSFSKNESHPFINSLPNILHIKQENNTHSSWLELMLNFIDFESKNHRPGTETILKKLTEVIFIQAFRVYLENSTEKVSYFNLINDAYTKKALDSIHNDISRKWSLDELALIAGMSRTNFSKHFKSISGTTPGEYITNLRITKAKELLSNTKEPVAEIAFSIGYQSSEHFQKSFKKKVGVTPSVFRKSLNLS